MNGTRAHRRLAVLVGTLLLLASCGHRQTAAPPAQIVAAAWDDYRAGDFDRASEHFESARARSTVGSADWSAATYGLAMTYQWRLSGADPARAVMLLGELSSHSSDAAWRDWSALCQMRAQHLTSLTGTSADRNAAEAAYAPIAGVANVSLAAEEAFLYLQANRVADASPAAARAALVDLDRFLVERPRSHYVSAVHGLRAAAFDVLDDQPQRLAAEIRALETRELDPSTPTIDDSGAYWSIASIAEFDVGDFATARDYYGRFIREFPTDQRLFSAKQALQRMANVQASMRQTAQVSR